MREPCRDRLGQLALAALGRLGAAERAALEGHAEHCPGCRQELRSLRSVGALLERAGFPPERGSAGEEPPPDLMDRIVARAARERRVRRRRAPVLAGAAAAVAALALGVVAVLVGWGDPGGPADPAGPAGPASTASTVDAGDSGGAERTVALESDVGIDAEARLVGRPWGTEILLEASGLEAGEVYWFWLTGEEGHRVPAGSFRGVPGRAEVVLAASLPLRDARRAWVTDAEDAVVLDADLR